MRFIDLFCGCGGWTTGLKMAGFEHIIGFDNDAYAIESYRANHGKDSAMCIDVRSLTPAILRQVTRGDHVHVVVASPPCQSFSLAGHRAQGDHRDDLYKHAISVAEALKSDYIVMENVMGILSKDSILTGRKTIDVMLEDIRQAGYTQVQYCVVKAERYKVPQLRRRVIIVGCRRSVPKPLLPPPEPLDIETFDASMKHILLPPEEVRDPFYWMTPEKAKWYRERHARTPSFVRFVDPVRPSFTARAGYAKSRGAEALVQVGDDRLRMLTEREFLRIQSFPDDYIIKGSRVSQYRQIGNAVPPQLAKHIGLTLLGTNKSRQKDERADSNSAPPECNRPH